jgi:hypothetical protein
MNGVNPVSESDLQIELEFEGEFLLKAVLDRVQAPLIIEEIKSRLPIDGRGALLRGEMKITLGIMRGNAKPTKDVSRGDIAYMPLGDTLCIYLTEMKTYSPVNIIGRITSDNEVLETLTQVRRGSQVTIRLSEN